MPAAGTGSQKLIHGENSEEVQPRALSFETLAACLSFSSGFLVFIDFRCLGDVYLLLFVH